MSIFRQNVNAAITMQSQIEQAPLVDEAAASADARLSLLAEVDFKWLMSGQGCWIDTARFHSDPAYAAGLIRFALASKSFALRERAAMLQAQMDGVSAPGAGPQDLRHRAPDSAGRCPPH